MRKHCTTETFICDRCGMTFNVNRDNRGRGNAIGSIEYHGFYSDGATHSSKTKRIELCSECYAHALLLLEPKLEE